MEEPTLASIAAMTARDVLRTTARQERLACIGECERRRTLWAETEDRSSTPPSLRTEARFCGNEAAVLADALRARGSA